MTPFAVGFSALALNNVIKYVYFYVVVNLPFRPWRKPNSALRAAFFCFELLFALPDPA
jgi:hypothetical protein